MEAITDNDGTDDRIKGTDVDRKTLVLDKHTEVQE